MFSARTATAVTGLLASLVITVALWWYFETMLVFLFLPFVPFLLRGRGREQPPVRECPVCEFQTRNEEYDYCPRDGHRLDYSNN
jgi:hypothetical protein